MTRTTITVATAGAWPKKENDLNVSISAGKFRENVGLKK